MIILPSSPRNVPIAVPTAATGTLVAPTTTLISFSVMWGAIGVTFAGTRRTRTRHLRLRLPRHSLCTLGIRLFPTLKLGMENQARTTETPRQEYPVGAAIGKASLEFLFCILTQLNIVES